MSLPAHRYDIREQHINEGQENRDGLQELKTKESNSFSLESFEKHMQEIIESHGPWHLKVGAAYSKIGTWCIRNGMLPDALVLYERDLLISRICIGNDSDLRVAGARYNLGLTLCRLGRFHEALQHLHKAFHARCKALGSTHHDIADTQSCIGGALLFLGRHREGVEWYEAALACRLLQSPSNHTSVAHDRLCLAEIQRSLGNCRAATQLGAAAYSAFLEALGPSNPSTVAASDLLDKLKAMANGKVRSFS